MIYLILLLLLLFCIYVYDIKNMTLNRQAFFYYILCFAVYLSAFKFRVGSDVLVYMEEYNSYPVITHLRFSDLTYNANRQPGWVILISLLRLFTSSFLLFQIVQAVFINGIIFYFIKKNTKYVFTALLLYVVYLYTELNFEVMRESFSVGFFILSVEAFRKNKWVLYYLFVVFAFLFHLSAFFLVLLPLIKLIPIHKVVIWGVFVFLIILLFCLPMLGGVSKDFVFLGTIGEKTTTYFNQEKYQLEITGPFLLKSLFLITVTYYATIAYNYKHKNIEKWFIRFLLIYFLFDILNRGIPIFYRLNNYLLIFYIIALAEFIVNFSHSYFFRGFAQLVYVVLLTFFCYFPIKSYFTVSEYNQVPAYRKYYPYYSYFSRKYDKQREDAFGF